MVLRWGQGVCVCVCALGENRDDRTGLPTSGQFILKSQWTFVQSLKKIPQSVLEISCSQKKRANGRTTREHNASGAACHRQGGAKMSHDFHRLAQSSWPILYSPKKNWPKLFMVCKLEVLWRCDLGSCALAAYTLQVKHCWRRQKRGHILQKRTERRREHFCCCC